MFIERKIKDNLLKFVQVFPVVAILGPRQSGKTTLAQENFKNYKYINLENLDIRSIAQQDPRGFLEKLLTEPGAIIDEFQHAPELLSYLQVIVDREKRPGFFILTGSHNFLMNRAISQSLAGRVGILTLLPLSIAEIKNAQLLPTFSEEIIVKGCYPKVYIQDILPSSMLYPSYIQTYIERDARELINIPSLTDFRRFMALCAGRTGQLLNVASLATDCGISQYTANTWLSILQASYIIFLLPPHHENFNKRLIKTPNLYFYDTGIACSLLGIETTQELDTHYMRGPLFENLIIADIQKQFYNAAKLPKSYFWRDSHGNEVDCIIDKAGKLLPIEIKAGMTISRNFLKGLLYYQELSGTQQGMLVYGGNEDLTMKNIEIKSWKDFSVV